MEIGGNSAAAGEITTTRIPDEFGQDQSDESRKKGKFELPDNSENLISEFENLNLVHKRNYEELNQIMKYLSNDGRGNRLDNLIDRDTGSERLDFEGIMSGLSKVIEGYVTDLAELIEVEGGRYNFNGEEGVLKSGLGYKFGASPETSAKEFGVFQDLPSKEKEQISEIFDSLTETFTVKGREGKYLEAFELYAETEKNQESISNILGIDPGELSRRKQKWENYGVVDEDRNHTEKGEIIVEMMDDLEKYM